MRIVCCIRCGIRRDEYLKLAEEFYNPELGIFKPHSDNCGCEWVQYDD